MNYTQEMERAMQQSHKFGYQEYCSKLDNQLIVESRREKEYEECKQLTEDLGRKLRR